MNQDLRGKGDESVLAENQIQSEKRNVESTVTIPSFQSQYRGGQDGVIYVSL